MRAPGRRFAGLAAVAVLAGSAGFMATRAWRAPARAARAARAVLLDAPPDLSRFDVPLRAAAAASGVEPALLRALVATESGGDPRARSRAGAVGLLQLVPSTAVEQAQALGLDATNLDLEDPATNLRLGAAYLARMLAAFDGDERFALAAYNAGPRHVRRWRLRAADAAPEDVLLREGFGETRHHVARTLRFRAAYL